MIDSYADFPTIDSAEDNYGHAWHKSDDTHNYILTEIMLRPGDLLTISVTSQRELKEDMFYSFQLGYSSEPCYQKDPHHTFEITDNHISRSIAVYIRLIRKHRGLYLYHEENDVQFRYTVDNKQEA